MSAPATSSPSPTNPLQTSLTASAPAPSSSSLTSLAILALAAAQKAILGQPSSAEAADLTNRNRAPNSSPAAAPFSIYA